MPHRPTRKEWLLIFLLLSSRSLRHVENFAQHWEPFARMQSNNGFEEGSRRLLPSRIDRISFDAIPHLVKGIARRNRHDQEECRVSPEDRILRHTASPEQVQHFRPNVLMRFVVCLLHPLADLENERGALSSAGLGCAVVYHLAHQETTVTANGSSLILPPSAATDRAGPSSLWTSTVTAAACSDPGGSGISKGRSRLFTNSSFLPWDVAKACAATSGASEPVRDVSTSLSPGPKLSLSSLRTQ